MAGKQAQQKDSQAPSIYVMDIPADKEVCPVVIALLDNLFFTAKLNEAAKPADLQIVTTRTAQAALEKARELQPLLIVIDLDALGCEPFSLIEQCKVDKTLSNIPLLGYVSHVNTGVQLAARRAGCNRVVARSVFSRDLPALFQEVRYGDYSRRAS